MERYIGKMLDNRYEILEVIGTGGMAVVFKAKCHRLNRLVAIKMLKKDLSEDAEFRRRFHDESQAVAMLSHPNIMAVYDVSRGGDMDYIVMELIDGITLKQYMERRGKLNWPEALHFITQIMKGLGHAHSRGIVHRDIKPQNIMILRDGTVKVTDFGIACLTNGPGNTSEAIGSVHYISPEQAKGEHTDNRSDIYSAGVVLYEMLTSRLPFEGDSPMAVAIQHFNAVPLNPREISPDIPEALEQICVKAMAPDRSKRYNTAEEMLADLEAFRKDPSVSFDYSVEDLRGSGGEDEPTQPMLNAGAARKNQVRYTPVEEDDMDDYDERPRSNWWKVLLLIVLIGGVGYFGVTRLYDSIMASFTITETLEYPVPSVVGLTVEDAEKLEGVLGIFEIVETDTREYDSSVPAGAIIRQDPDAESRKKKTANGSLIPITVVVSRGARSGAMPDLVGEEGRSAQLRLDQNKDLKALGLTVEMGESDYDDEIPAGSVIRTDPAAGIQLKEGDTVTLYLSLGPELSVMVPCLNQSREWVEEQMAVLQLTPEFTVVEGSAPAGTVLSQSVEANTEVPHGSTVAFTVSDGNKELTRTVTFTVPEGDAKQRVEIYLGTALSYGEDHAPGDKIEHVITAKPGDYQLRIFSDGILCRDETLTFADE